MIFTELYIVTLIFILIGIIFPKIGRKWWQRSFLFPLIILLLSAIVLYIPFLVYVLDKNAKPLGEEGLVLGIFVLPGIAAPLVIFIFQMVANYRRLRSAKVSIGEKTEKKNVWWYVLGGVIAYLFLTVYAEPTALGFISSKVHPYGIGRTKDTQFTGLYRSVNINGTPSHRLSLDVADATAQADTYNGIHLCLWGHFANDANGMTIRPVAKKFDPVDPNNAVWITLTGQTVGLRCPQGKSSCEGDITPCGEFQVATAGSGFGNNSFYHHQLVVDSLDEIYSLGDPPFDYNKYISPSVIFDNSAKYQGQNVCVHGYYETRPELSAMGSGVNSNETLVPPVIWMEIPESKMNPAFCRLNSKNEDVCLYDGYACGVFQSSSNGKGYGFEHQYGSVLTNIDAASVFLSNGR